MAPLHYKNRRERVPSTIYDHNYNFTMNIYKPMIDFLDEKKSGRSPKYPHLPFNNELGLEKYSSNNSVRVYSDREINKLKREAERAAKEQLPDFRSNIHRSAFSVIKRVDASRLCKHVAEDSVYERQHQRVKQHLRDYEATAKAESMELQKISNLFAEAKREEFSPSLKKAMRGKSALQIRNILLTDTNRQLELAAEEERRLMLDANKRIRSQSADGRYNRMYHVRFCDNSCTENLINKTVSTSFENVKRDIQEFTHKAEEVLNDTR